MIIFSLESVARQQPKPVTFHFSSGALVVRDDNFGHLFHVKMPPSVHQKRLEHGIGVQILCLQQRCRKCPIQMLGRFTELIQRLTKF